MTVRAGQPDTQADVDVRTCLDRQPPQTFNMVAGAGSGKTTSLIKALEYLSSTRGAELRRAGQQIACITYTEVAVGEIWGDVRNASLFHVSTIHSFLWSVIRPFQSDIRQWVLDRISEKIVEKRAHIDKPRTHQKTKDRLQIEIAELQQEVHGLAAVERFTYGTGSDYASGVLGHADILKMVPACIETHALLRKLIASRFPYIFVDESQDTNLAVVEAVRRISNEFPRACVGFFGDPMQKIYTTGGGAITLEDGWCEITKPENFRCPSTVLNVINAIRAAGDGLTQIGGRTIENEGVKQAVAGSAQLFVLPADAQRTACLASIRQWLATASSDPLWLSDDVTADVRLLVLVHRMAAARLGFPNLYAALHDQAPASLKDGLDDGSSWPLRPLLQDILPLVLASRVNDEFQIMSILRERSALLKPDRVKDQSVPAVLARLQAGMKVLTDLLAEGSQASVRDVLQCVSREEILPLDDRFARYLVPQPIDDGRSEFKHLTDFLNCRVSEIWGYRKYVEEQSPFATQQGVKGAQFDRVLVVIDDEEGSHSHFSYGKYFGFVALSDKDDEKIAEGADSVLDRTRRLFYVCCSRAVQDLAVVIFVPDVALARAAIEATGIFPVGAIFEMDALP